MKEMRMRQHESRETERDLAAIPEQGQESGHDPFIVEHDRFLAELIKAVGEDEMSKETSVPQELRSPVPSPVPARSERVRYSFD
jgi:hypothetical protein